MNSALPDDQLPPLNPATPIEGAAPPLPGDVKMPKPPQSDEKIQPILKTDDQPIPPVVSFAMLEGNSPPSLGKDLAATKPLPEEPPLPTSPGDKPVMAVPTKEDIGQEEAFPGQPIPESQQKNLEEQAEKLIGEGGKPVRNKLPSKAIQTVLGVLALVLVGSGVYFGQQLVTTGGVGDIRQQARETSGVACDDYTDCETGEICTGNVCVLPYVPNTDGCNGACNSSQNCVGGVCRDKSAFDCDMNNPDACGGHPEDCHCTGGNDCTGTKCEPNVEVFCDSVGRSYCDNVYGFGKTCCVEGYTCCRTMDGCCQTGEPPGTNTPNVPPPNEPPGETLVCSGMTSVPAKPKLGDSVRYTCTGAASPKAINHYEFQYKAGTGEFASLAAEAAGNAQSTPLVINNPGTYVVRCRACTSSDGTACTAWHTL